MAVQSISGFYWPPYTHCAMIPAYNAAASMSVANGKVAFIFPIPRTGNVTKLVWRTQTVTTGATIEVRLETVDTSTGLPSGTLVGTNTNASVVVNSADDNTVFETTLTAAAAVTAGQIVAMVFVNPGASFGSMGFSWINYSGSALGIPYYNSYNGASWGLNASASLPVMALLYDDGLYEVPFSAFAPGSVVTSTAFNTASTPDVLSARFRLPMGVRVAGAWVAIELDAPVKVMIVNSAYNQGAGTGILATSNTLNAGQRSGSAGAEHFVTFTSPVDLDANTWYRLAVEPTSTPTNTTVYDFTYGSLALMEAQIKDFHLSTAKDPTADGSWTNYNSGTFRAPFMGLYITGIDVTEGSGTGGPLSVVNYSTYFANNASGAASVAAPATSLTAENTILVAIRSGNGSTVSGVSDTAGNRYVKLHTQNRATQYWEMWACWNASGHASNVVTAAFSGSSSTYNAIATAQISGTAPSSYDGSWGTTQGSGFWNTITTTGIYTRVVDTILLAFSWADTSGSWTPSTGWTELTEEASGYIQIQYLIVSTLQTNISVDATNSGTPGKNMIVVALAQGETSGSSGGGLDSYPSVG